MYSPIIGILGDTMRYHSPAFGEVEKQYANQKYVTAVEQNGGIPLVLPVCGDAETVAAMVGLCDGLLFPGGDDVDPSLYGEGPHRKLGEIRPAHDRFLLAALQEAKKRQLPCLGICKGLQIMVVDSGGTLYQDVHDQIGGGTFLHCQRGQRDYLIHKVNVQLDSRLFRILGESRVGVNSLHHQSARTMGDNLQVVATADDGVIEAVESRDGLWIGVQWHPEELVETAPAMNRLFADLAERARKRREGE